MGATLHYTFERRSKNYLEWLLHTVKSQRYYESDAIIVNTAKPSSKK